VFFTLSQMDNHLKPLLLRSKLCFGFRLAILSMYPVCAETLAG
jgi:hypothetical protein